MTPREFLESGPILEAEAASLQRMLDDLESSLFLIRSPMGSDGSGSRPTRVNGETAATLKVQQKIDLEADLNDALTAVLRRAAEINRAIASVQDDQLRLLLRLRYKERMPWKRVADELYTSERGIYRMNKTALEGIKAWMDANNIQ